MNEKDFTEPGQMQRVLKTAWPAVFESFFISLAGMIDTLIMAIFMAVFYFFFGKALFGLFFQEESIIEIGAGISRIIIVIVLFQICQVIFTGCLRGAGDVVYTMICSCVSATFVRTIASYVCCYFCGWGIYGIWMGIVADQFCRLTLSSIRFRGGKWMQIHI
ncbi:MAG: hypothetical protein LUI07_08860 [Lachnospiraceae bacterium]|nr:hypothetical protein [Lachnospiraceae bacterium]